MRRSELNIGVKTADLPAWLMVTKWNAWLFENS